MHGPNSCVCVCVCGREQLDWDCWLWLGDSLNTRLCWRVGVPAPPRPRMNINNSKWSQSGPPLRLLAITPGWADIAVPWKATDRRKGRGGGNHDVPLKGTTVVSAIRSTEVKEIYCFEKTGEGRGKKNGVLQKRDLNGYTEDWFLFWIRPTVSNLENNTHLCWWRLWKKRYLFTRRSPALFFLIPLIVRAPGPDNETGYLPLARVKSLGWPDVTSRLNHTLIPVVRRDDV